MFWFILTTRIKTFIPPNMPVLLQILSGVPAQDLLPSGSVYTLPPNKVIEVSIPGGSPGAPVCIVALISTAYR
jgi:hypothetical protein